MKHRRAGSAGLLGFGGKVQSHTNGRHSRPYNYCSADIAFKNAPVLRAMKTLKTINGKPAVEFWEGLEETGGKGQVTRARNVAKMILQVQIFPGPWN